MFQLLPCSICQRTFSLRKDVGEETLLKCPSCGNQFRLGDVLDAFYSPWIILDEPGAAVTQPVSLIDAQSPAIPLNGPTDSRLSFDNLLSQDPSSDSPLRSNALTDDPSELAADDVFNSADLELPDSSADEPALLVDNNDVGNSDLTSSDLESSDLESEIELDDEPLPDEPIAIGSHQYESPMDSFGSGQTAVKKSRLRKSERGGVWSVVQVILGGAAAIPVTVLLLWYVVGKDVMDAGPTVARYVPWIVPKKFRTNNQEFTQRPTGPRVPPPALGEGGFRNFDEELKQQQNNSPADPTPVAEVGEAATGSVKSASAVQPVSSDSPAPIQTSVNEDNVVEDKAMIQAFAMVKQVKGAVEGWNNSVPEANQQALAIFNDLAGLAEQLDTLSTEGGGLKMLKNELGKVGQAIIKNQPLRYQLFLKSPVEYKETANPAQVGRLLLVPAEEVEATETSWIIRAKVGDSKVTIEVPKEVLPEPAKGAPIFCLGQANDDGQPKSYRVKSRYLKVLN